MIVFLVEIQKQDTGSSFEKSDNDEKQRNGVITRKRWDQGRSLRMLCGPTEMGERKGREEEKAQR